VGLPAAGVNQKGPSRCGLASLQRKRLGPASIAAERVDYGLYFLILDLVFARRVLPQGSLQRPDAAHQNGLKNDPRKESPWLYPVLE